MKNHPFFEGVDWDNLLQTKLSFQPDLDDEFDTGAYSRQTEQANKDRQTDRQTDRHIYVYIHTYPSFLHPSVHSNIHTSIRLSIHPRSTHAHIHMHISIHPCTYPPTHAHIQHRLLRPSQHSVDVSCWQFQ